MKVFFASIPYCLDPGIWSALWRESNHTQSHVLHSHLSEVLLTLDAVHDFLRRHETTSREEADWVYLPAYFPLIFWYESEESLNCVQQFFDSYDFGPNAGYDHLINYGHEYPHWKRKSLVLPEGNRLLDLDGYHVFLRNAFVLTVGHTHAGRRNFALGVGDKEVETMMRAEAELGAGGRAQQPGESDSSSGRGSRGGLSHPSSFLHDEKHEPHGARHRGGLLYLQRFVVHPYFVKFDCDVAYREMVEFGSRPVKVLFVGAVKQNAGTNFVFRERVFMLEAYERRKLKLDGDVDANDVYFQPIAADDDSRRQLRLKQEEWLLLYQSARLCLVMPGDGNTAQRLFHVLTQACVPVFVYHKDSYVVLPFEQYLNYHEFSLLFLIDSVEEAGAVLDFLVGAASDGAGTARGRMMLRSTFFRLHSRKA